jgi:hypothetical protein
MRRLSRCEDRGAVAVEFALVFPLAVMMLAFLAAIGMRVLWGSLADNATRAATRYASVPNYAGQYPHSDASSNGMQSVTSTASGAYGGMLGGATVMGSVCSAADESNCEPSVLALNSSFQCDRPGHLVTVQVSYHVPGLSGLQGLINAIPGAPDVTALDTVTNVARARCE